MRDGKVLQYDTPLSVIMRPADEFVAKLVGADDNVRRLSLVSAESAMIPLQAGATVGADEPAVDMPARVLHALNVLLESGAPRVIVRKDGTPIGYLDLHAVQAASVPRVHMERQNGAILSAGETPPSTEGGSGGSQSRRDANNPSHEPRSFVPQDDTIPDDTAAERRGDGEPS
jgi:hypothetical protein